MTQDPERLAEKLGHLVRYSDSSLYDLKCDRCGGTDLKGDDMLRRPCIPRTLKPSERGPTNDEIIAEADRRFRAAPQDYPRYAKCVIEATRDQSWFKPATDAGPTNDDETSVEQIMAETEHRFSKDQTKPPLRHAIEAMRDTSWHKPEPEVDEATLVAREVAASFLATMPWVYSSAEWLAGKADNHRGFAVIAEALAKRDDELTKGKAELRRLLEVIHKSDYAEKAPTWRPLDDLVGMVTQIDNMYAGVRAERDQALAKRPRVEVPPCKNCGFVPEKTG